MHMMQTSGFSIEYIGEKMDPTIHWLMYVQFLDQVINLD